ncbi:MAG: PP2C family protein-serine/threonine phosphatase [Anaerolineae bacterium]|nr:PP2C family protein-serine/threonine phosphatase [Anaerolineae bacterium]
MAPIVDDAGNRLGELWVDGVQGDAVLARLQADAALLASLTTLEDEVESLADALAETEDQLLALYELNKVDSGRLDIDRLLHGLVQQAMRLVKADAAFVVLTTPSRIVRSPGLTTPDPCLIQLFERVRKAGSEILLRDTALAFGRTNGKGNVFIVPLPLRERCEIIAALGLWLDRPASTLSPALKLARSIAEQAGAQLEIVLLHEQLVAQARLQTEMELARMVQVSLLPQRSPVVRGLDIYGTLQPALHVGGDFFDYIVPDDANGRPFTFVVGDVSGKGLPAALLMAMTRTNLRSIALRTANSTPASILAQANENLYEDFTKVGMMATVCIGQYDPAGGKLTVANAGHSPVIICSSGSAARLLEADGPPLGVLPLSLWHNTDIPFQPGDVLVVATDGLNEERNSRSELFGMDRLLRQVDRLSTTSSKDIADGLLSAVAQFDTDATQDDDQTVVVLKAC